MRGGDETNWRPSVESEQPALRGGPEIQPGALLRYQSAHSPTPQTPRAEQGGSHCTVGRVAQSMTKASLEGEAGSVR